MSLTKGNLIFYTVCLLSVGHFGEDILRGRAILQV